MRFLPAVTFQQCLGRVIGIQAPRREQAHVRPIADIRSNGVARFIDLHRDIPGNQMGRGSEAHRACAYDGNGMMVLAHARSLTRFLTVVGSQAGAAQLAAAPWQQFSVR